MRRFLVARDSFIADQLVGAGSTVLEADLNGAKPGSNLVEVDDGGRPVNPEDAAKLVVAPGPRFIAPVMPHAPTAVHPQGLPPQRAGGLQLAGNHLRQYHAAEGAQSNEDAEARVKQLREELAEAEAVAESVRKARAELAEEAPRRRGAPAASGEPGILDRSITDLETYIETINDREELTRLRDAEVGGKSRTGALAAIDNRLASLDDA
jgi:hypothetical protein